MGGSDDAFNLSIQAIERLERALGLVAHPTRRMFGIRDELRRKADACRQLAADAEDKWRKALWMERAQHWELEAARVEREQLGRQDVGRAEI
jgi:hypothetical protein